MTRFEDRLREVRGTNGDDYYLGLEAIAEGLAEIIGLLRPLVDTVTAQPEPVTIRSSGFGIPCLAGDPGSNGFRRCSEPYGHDGDHKHRDRLSGMTTVWSQPVQVPPPDRCASNLTDTGGSDREGVNLQCVMPRGHDGLHTDGTWNANGPMIWGA